MCIIFDIYILIYFICVYRKVIESLVEVRIESDGDWYLKWNIFFCCKICLIKNYKIFFLRKFVLNFLGGIINKIFYYIVMKFLIILWGYIVMFWMVV